MPRKDVSKTEPVKKAVSRRQVSSEKPAPKVQEERKGKTVSKGAGSQEFTREQREAVLQKYFCQEGVDYLRDTFGIDLRSEQVGREDLYRIARGCVTGPIGVTVTPTVVVDGSKYAAEPVKTIASFRILMPMDKNYKPVAPSADHPVNISSYPCFDYLYKVEEGQEVPVEEALSQSDDSSEKLTAGDFSEAQLKALESIGVSASRLDPDSFNPLSEDVKSAILAGEEFAVTGTLRVADGFGSERFFPVNGTAVLSEGADGAVKAAFTPQEPVYKNKNLIEDLTAIAVIGNIKLRLFAESEGGVFTTTKAVDDLLQFGHAVVDGDVLHYKNDESGQSVSFTTHEKFVVSFRNGGIVADRLDRVKELGKDGQPLTTWIGGKKVEKYHYEYRDAKVAPDGTVRVGFQSLKPASDKDLQNFRAGIGGKFLGFEYTDQRSGKKIGYDAFVVPDNQGNGFGRPYSAENSRKMLERIERQEEQVKKARAKKTQNFRHGI